MADCHGLMLVVAHAISSSLCGLESFQTKSKEMADYVAVEKTHLYWPLVVSAMPLLMSTFFNNVGKGYLIFG